MVNVYKSVSVVVLYFNDIHINESVKSIKRQTVIPDEIIIIDDFSNTPLDANITNSDCKIIRNSQNMGRGYSRNLGIKESKSEFVVFCDSSNALCENFIEKALLDFKSKKISAVFGKIVGKHEHKDACSRWRERNLFLETYPFAKEPYRVFSLSTYAVMIRKSHAKKTGNFDKKLRRFEDHDLGERLLAKGYEILFNPNLFCVSNRKEDLYELATRVDRWYSPSNEELNFKSCLDLLKTSFFIWLKKDIESEDYRGILISLCIPIIIIYQNITND